MKTRRIAIGWSMLLVSLLAWMASSEAQGDVVADTTSAGRRRLSRPAHQAVRPT